MDGMVKLPKILPLAIATSSHSGSVEKKRVHHQDMFQRFDAIVSTDDPAVQNGKPAPDIYLEAAKRINVPPNQCIVFEDGMPGVLSGKAAGAFVIAVPDPRFTAQEIEELFAPHADLVLKDMTEFDWKTVCDNMAKKQQKKQSNMTLEQQS
ncbi:MAG: hypothetical protein SGARI_007376 [Bacillariaceae sp.]